MLNAKAVSAKNPILIDRFLQNALEVEADAISDGKSAFVPAVMQHIELAGIHSGDSACVIPSISISDTNLETIRAYTRRIAVELGVCGLLNIQYAIAEDETVFILEANPRASRTVPLVSKVCGIAMVPAATEIIMARHAGKEYDFTQLKPAVFSHFGVKEAVFPFNMFPEVDPVLGPEMLSTGEVLGLADSFGAAFLKAEEAAKMPLPTGGCAFISVNDNDKPGIVPVARAFERLGFSIISTGGTCRLLRENGVGANLVSKLHEGGSNIIPRIESGEVTVVINTPTRNLTAEQDDSYIRKAAIKCRTAYFTTLAAASAAVTAIGEAKCGLGAGVRSLQEYHRNVKSER